MKRISKLLSILSCMGSLCAIDAKQVELHFNRTAQESFVLNATIDDQILTPPWQTIDHPRPIYCQKLTIENKGDRLLENCLPFINRPSLYTADGLRQRLAETDQPLLALHELWNRSLVISSSAAPDAQDPLCLLNFAGRCDQSQYVQGFAALCRLVGIPTRPAAVHGKDIHDFYCGHQWMLFDPLSAQAYLGLDNRSFISSEDIMDDPFLALRAKHHRQAAALDFNKNWEQAALFEIVTPCLGEENASIPNVYSIVAKGFDLYPGERLIYHCQELSLDNPFIQNGIEHVIDMKERQASGRLGYQSAFPIKAIKNHSNSAIFVESSQRFVQPGELVSLSGAAIFDLSFRLDETDAGRLSVYSACSPRVFPQLTKGINEVYLGVDHNPTSIDFIYELNEDIDSFSLPALNVSNDQSTFDHCAPFFQIENRQCSPTDAIWWQIASDSDFRLSASNFEQIQPYEETIRLPSVTDSFFNADQTYYFRVKGCANQTWGDWSETFAFIVKKPEPVKEIAFEKTSEGQYRISWTPSADSCDSVDYLIFGSNSLDFVPSVYCDTQINALLNGQAIEVETNQNLTLITSDCSFIADGSLAYYRLIARRHGQLSTPSALIHVYDQDLHQERTVLQVIEQNDERSLAKRTKLPSGYQREEEVETCAYSPLSTTLRLLKAQPARLSSGVPTKRLVTIRSYAQNPHVAADSWAQVERHFLPDNHPVKPKLDRLFSSSRVILSSDTFRQAGFKRYKQGRFSRIMASGNPRLIGYFVKAFPDTELNVTEDWRKLSHRIEGSHSIRQCIARHGYQDRFKVPHKWLYPLPVDPSPPQSSKYLRKNFILVAEDMQILDHDANEKKYYKKMSPPLLDALYTILSEEGLYDSVFAFNIPFCKDGKIAFIDTEYHHKWPINYYKLSRYLSPHMQKYWTRLVAGNGPTQTP